MLTSRTTTTPLFCIAAWPPVIVSPDKVVPVVKVAKIDSSPSPSTTVLSAPAPCTSTSSVIGRYSISYWTRYGDALAGTITTSSTAVVAFEAISASRSEQSPDSQGPGTGSSVRVTV
jgi:hypothetical protein